MHTKILISGYVRGDSPLFHMYNINRLLCRFFVFGDVCYTDGLNGYMEQPGLLQLMP